MDAEQIARRRALGIPVHESDAEHEWRADGWCNCGERRPTKRRDGPWRALPPAGRTTPRSSLDYLECNEDNR